MEREVDIALSARAATAIAAPPAAATATTATWYDVK